MKQNAINVFTKMCNEMTQMPYYKNYAVSSGNVHNISKHEDAITDLLLQNGFIEFIPGTKKNKQKRTYDWIEHTELSEEMPINTFIYQPCGTHQSPDFIIKLLPNLIIPLECKSAEKHYPLYNSGGINSTYLYVFTSKKYNNTTIYMGFDIVTAQQQLLINEHIHEARERDIILNQKLKELDLHHRGITYYTRPMINQEGGKSYCDYFTHCNKNISQENVVKYFTEKIEL